jgi:hypothetical protein
MNAIMDHQLSVGAAEELLRVTDADERRPLAALASAQHWERPQVRAVQDVLNQGPVSDLTASARSELRRLYQRLALRVAD